MLWLWVLAIVLMFFVLWKTREGLTPNAYEKCQIAQGDLANIDAQIEEVMSTRSKIDEIKVCVEENQNNIRDIQKEVGKKGAINMPMAYPMKPQTT